MEKHRNITYSQEKLFFTSDSHFNHAKMILPTYCDRPFKDAEDMNSELIRRWNKKVPKDGIVFHLGDFAWGSTTGAQKLLESLNGTIHLVIGNHDKTVLKKQYTRDLFESIQHYVKIRIGDKDAIGGKGYQEIVLMHYPILAWDKIRHGAWHLFGHEHGNFKHHTSHGHESHQACIDVGVDNEYTDFAPLSYHEVKDIITKKISQPVKKTVSYALCDDQILKLEKWQAKIKKKFGKFGNFEFRFRPTGIGTITLVWSDLLKEELDLTETKKW